MKKTTTILATFVFALVPQVASAAPTCSSAAADSDGDGWGWENNTSCVVAQGSPSGTTTPVGGSATCVDSDGDGWGWDGTASCQVGGISSPGTSTPAGSATCVDSDGDGWGWDGSASCQVSGGTTNPGTTNPGTTNPGGGNTGVAQGNFSPVTGSCAQPSPGSVMVSSTVPVKETNNPDFYPAYGPQCVGPGNQWNGPGLAFGDFIVKNNAWNAGTSSANWTQCISLEDNGAGFTTPSWTYDWGNEDDLQPGFQEWEVKSYPEIIYGVKALYEESGSCEDTGLPVQYSQMPQFDIEFSYSAPETNLRSGDLGDVPVQGGDRNIAIESFLHDSCNIRRGANSNRTYELMVWLEKGNERLPSGKPPVGTYTDQYGHVFDIYTKPPAQDDGYIAYVARTPIRDGSLNWTGFFEDAKANSDIYGTVAIQDSWCLGNILFGSEIWWGQGSFELDYLQIQRSY